ncbi:hypothetical protein B0J15DRAFT_481956 [Fusarium solani]|uniref:Secreted protein n=1 Tax=Fusarium solani TaxID=169388 RepID=A0A9P9L1J1_FUSSL|nr:uncharacterized protein B0J15DRAFT_481956 [Fusarium solani]KAH7272489.1 hypothetical protein B0J15DRAFT_481956 [Fusarium solani]
MNCYWAYVFAVKMGLAICGRALLLPHTRTAGSGQQQVPSSNGSTMLLRGSICGSSVVDGSALTSQNCPAKWSGGAGSWPSSFCNGAQACETRRRDTAARCSFCVVSTMSSFSIRRDVFLFPLFRLTVPRTEGPKDGLSCLLGVGEWVIFRSEINVFVGWAA